MGLGEAGMPCGQKIAGVGAEDREGGALALGCGGSSPPASPVPLRYVPGHHPPFRWNEAPGLWTFPRPPVVCVAERQPQSVFRSRPRQPAPVHPPRRGFPETASVASGLSSVDILAPCAADQLRADRAHSPLVFLDPLQKHRQIRQSTASNFAGFADAFRRNYFLNFGFTVYSVAAGLPILWDLSDSPIKM